VRWAAILACLATSAYADLFHLYGYGPRAAAMGGAMTAEANDYTAAFYNPARLVDRKEFNFGFHFQWNRLVPNVESLDRARPVDCSTCQPPDAVGTAFGFLFPLAGKVKNHVAIGVGVYLPTGVLLRLQATDPGSPSWYRFQGNTERLGLHLGVGIKIVEWFKIGLGLQVLADLLGKGGAVRVDVFSKEVERRDLDAYLATRAAPVVGLSIAPLQRLRIGVTYRAEIMLRYEIPATVELDGIGTLGFTLAGVAHYHPHNVSGGVAFDVTDALTVSLDVDWSHWSAAPSPYLSLDVDLSGPTLDGLGLGSALDILSPTQRPGFVDTVGVRLGGEYRLSERFAARAGGFYRPTPVPRQDTAGTNLMDNAAIGAAVGVGFNFPDPLEIFASPIQIDVAAQAQFLLAREARKEPADATPPYRYAANVFGVTAAIRYDF
jgi:long-chain fatty acid transport protein